MKTLVALVVIAAVCFTSNATAQSAPGKSGAARSNAVTDAPLTSVQQDAIDRYVTAEMARQRIPGLAIGVYRRGYPFFLKSYGLANIEWQTPVGIDTRMQTGSLGKQFVATAILRLAEQGKVDIDASITKYFPEAPASWRPITVANLLSHTSGIGVYDTPENTDPGGKFDYRQDFTEKELAAKISALPIDFKVGTDWRYNNTNYVMLGILVHRVTGKPHGDYLRDEFFTPLGMRSTRIISDTDVITRRASGYEIKAGELRNQQWVSATFNSTGDGTTYTTVEDMARWDRALYDDTLLSPASKNRMWTPFLLANGKPNSAGYGFAWFVGAINGHRTIEHGGAWQGFTSNMTRYPDDGLTVTAFVNLDSNHARPNQIVQVVAGLVSPALMPPLATPLADDPARAKKLRTFLARAAGGADLSADFDVVAGYKPDPLAAKELAAALPGSWLEAPMTLIRRANYFGGMRYGYRIGPAGNTRVLAATIMPSGKLGEYAVLADPDNR